MRLLPIVKIAARRVLIYTCQGETALNVVNTHLRGVLSPVERMRNSAYRRRIVSEAAFLIYSGRESEFHRAKLAAGRRVGKGVVRSADLPTNAEVREELMILAARDPDSPTRAKLDAQRATALRLMRLLSAYNPRLAGGVLTGRLRRGGRIELHVFHDSVAQVEAALSHAGAAYQIEIRTIVKRGKSQRFLHYCFNDAHPVRVTRHNADRVNTPFRGSITARPIRLADIAEVERLLENSTASGETAEPQIHAHADARDVYLFLELLLEPLERVKLDPATHPEGDALYHSLQVFELAAAELPYDEEFIAAALLHEVGRAIDRKSPVTAALEVLEDVVTQRTLWLIEHLASAHAILTGAAGLRLRRRLEREESYEELMLLARCDRSGRRTGVPTRDVRDALAYLRKLDALCRE